MRLLSFLLLAVLASAADPKVTFNRDVRPILSDKCFHCHGADAKSKGISLRLDVEASARQAVAAGKLITRISTDKKGQQMPPPYSGLSLTAKEKEILTAWVAQGAEWQPHWSFVPPQAPCSGLRLGGPVGIRRFGAGT